MNPKPEQFGSLGAILAAAACPVCFPKLALVGALIGLGALAQYELYFLIAAQLLVLIALAGVLWAYRELSHPGIPILAITSVVLFFASLYLIANEYLSYVALAGLVASMIWQLVETKRCLKNN